MPSFIFFREVKKKKKSFKLKIHKFFIPCNPLINANVAVLIILAKLLLLYQDFIYKTYVFSQLYQFWTDIQTKLVNKNFYIADIKEIRLKLAELQKLNEEVQKIKATKELSRDRNKYKEINEVLYRENYFLYLKSFK